MKRVDGRAVSQRFRQQYGVASRPQLRALGVPAAQERQRVARGEWDRPAKRVVRLAGSPPSPEQELMIALLEAGPSAIASHQSAAWLWGLLPPPDRHSVIVGEHADPRRGRFALHRPKGEFPAVTVVRHIPTTNPLRALVDLAGVVEPEVLDEALDRAVAIRLVTVEAVRAEVERVSRKGRIGAGAMRAAFRRRGLHEGPHPSVLEARLHRLLATGGVTPIKVEVVAGPEGQYRIDTLLDPLVAVEVDGHAFHSTPEQKAYDERRRSDIRLSGVFLLVYSWRDIHHDGRRVLAECHQALARYGLASHRRPAS